MDWRMGGLISSHEGGELAQTLRGTLKRGLLTLRPQSPDAGRGADAGREGEREFLILPRICGTISRALTRG